MLGADRDLLPLGDLQGKARATPVGRGRRSQDLPGLQLSFQTKSKLQKLLLLGCLQDSSIMERKDEVQL